MQYAVQATASLKTVSDCLVLPLQQGQSAETVLAPFSKPLAKIARGVIERGDFSAKQSEILVLHTDQPGTYPRLLLLGLGGKAPDTPGYLAAARVMAKALLKLPIKTAAVVAAGLAAEGHSRAWCAEQLTRQVAEADYRFDQFKTKKSTPAQLKKMTLATESGKGNQALKSALNAGDAIGAGTNLARKLGDLPANTCNPSYLASQARSLAREHKPLSCKVINEKEMQAMGMHSLLSVTAGTKTPARLIVLNYRGDNKKGAKPIVLVGKGVTFDSGGISLKPSGSMDEMKYDMCGAASVLGAVSAVAKMALPVNLVAIIPAVENMPSGTATRPGDIVKSMSGQTIEILNTDAEGRLILCDALTYAKRFDPEVVIDIATLTGACVVALGSHASAMYSNDETLAGALLAAGSESGDRCWRMPLWPEYDKQLKSNFADMANIGGPKAGSVTAACFLSRFTRDYHWAHLDIAGSAWNQGANKGATGRPVPLLMQYLRSQCQ